MSSEIHVEPTGAMRSIGCSDLDYSSIPPVAMMAIARTMKEGADKYGRFNYVKGFPITELLNHAMDHLWRFNAGSRLEPHLEHAATNLLFAIQEYTLNREEQDKLLLGPGCTIPEEMEFPDPDLDKISDSYWDTKELPGVKEILEIRRDMLAEKSSITMPHIHRNEEDFPTDEQLDEIRTYAQKMEFGPIQRVAPITEKENCKPGEFCQVSLAGGWRAYFKKPEGDVRYDGS